MSETTWQPVLCPTLLEYVAVEERGKESNPVGSNRRSIDQVVSRSLVPSALNEVTQVLVTSYGHTYNLRGY